MSEEIWPGPITIGPPGADSAQPLEIVSAGSGGLAITAPSGEAYVVAFMKDATGRFLKVGATAFQFPNPDTTSGYASWNVHTTALTNGVAFDHIDLAIWAKHGAAIFSEDVGPGTAPGANVLDVFGQIAVSPPGSGFRVPNTLLHVWKGSAGAATSRPEVVATFESAGDVGLQLLSPSTGTQYLFFGDDTANNVGWIRYLHTTDVLEFRAGVGVRITAIPPFAAGDRYLVADAAGNIHRSTIGPSR